MPKFIDSEQKIVDLFKNEEKFIFEGKEYKIVLCGKPRPSSGECKTDVYVKGRSADGEVREIKISVKQTNADFLENKISLERAKEILGPQAEEIIEECTTSIKNSFEEDSLVYFEPQGHTGAETIKLGWKFELLNKPGGLKSGVMELSDMQKYDIFAGINLSPDKRNSKIDGVVVENSGVANYIIELDGRDIDLAECLNMLQSIEEYAKNQTIYFACKALNYRHDKKKWDGPRPLSVYVKWSINKGKLCSKLVFNEPLKHDGNEIGNHLCDLLKQLNINKFVDLKKKLSSDVKRYPAK